MTKQQLIAKYAKKFVYSDKVNQLNTLRGIYYAPEGSVIVCNRVCLLHVKNAHQLKNPVILDPKDGLPIVEGEYPDVSKVLSRKYRDCIRLSGQALTATACAEAVSKLISGARKNTVTIMIRSGVATFRIEQNPVIFEAHFGNTDRAESSERIFNAQYLHTALSVLSEGGSGQSIIHFNGVNDPIKVTDESEEVEVIIMPYST